MCDYNLIVKDLQEIVGKELLYELAIARVVQVYWGTAPTGRIHLGYFLPMLKIAELLKANCGVTILIADLHAMLDNLKSTPLQVGARSDYYTLMIREILSSLGVDLTRIRFIRGTDFQLCKEYTMDMYKINTLCTLKDAQHAGAEVVKQSDNPIMTGLMYPTLQALDEEYLNVDAQLGGVDQRKIFMFAREYMPKIGYKKRIHLMTRMIPGLRKGPKSESTIDDDGSVINKMSASDESTKLDILDTPKQIRKKVNCAYCVEGDTIDNSVLDILRDIIFPLLHFCKRDFVINRKEEHGGKLLFTDFSTVESEYSQKKLHPADLKMGVADAINDFFEPIRGKFSTKKMKELMVKAYS
jgi:tyrosyl-tRNA synthetase